MKKWNYLLLVMAAMLAFAGASVAADAATVVISLFPDSRNPSVPVMGDHLHFHSTITNVGAASIQGLVAWISLVEIDKGNEQPVDLEDWSAHKAVTGAYLIPGEALETDWPMRLIKGGDYRVVICAIDRGARRISASPTLRFHVRQKAVLQAGRVLLMAVGVPLLIACLMLFTRRNSIHNRLRKSGGPF
jgi:hypothetical protein